MRAPSPFFLQIRLTLLEISRSFLNLGVFLGRYRLGRIICHILMLKRKFALLHSYGGIMVFDLKNPHELSMYLDFFAPELSKIMRKLLRPGDCFIDCGVNNGYYSCIGASLVGGGSHSGRCKSLLH